MPLFADDGCVIPNIPTRLYRVTLTAACEHGKIRRAEIDLNATGETEAISHVTRFLRLPGMVIESADELIPAQPDPPHCRNHLEFRSDCDQCVSARQYA